MPPQPGQRTNVPRTYSRLVAEGDCYPSSTVWKGEFGIRLSVSNWRTDEDDISAIVASLERAVAGSA